MHRSYSFIITCLITCLISTHSARASSTVTADTQGGYSNLVLDKILNYWQSPKKQATTPTRILLAIGSNGELEDCMILASSGFKDIDEATCKSAKEASPFAPPPLNIPIDVYMAFWTGKSAPAQNVEQSKNLNIQPAPHIQPAPPERESIEDILNDAGLGNEPQIIQGSDLVKSDDLVILYNDTQVNTQDEVQTSDYLAINLYPETQTPKRKVYITLEGKQSKVMTDQEFYATKLIRKIEPFIEYPSSLPLDNFSTSLIATINSDGFIIGVELANSSMHKELDLAIINATRKLGQASPPPSGEEEEVYLRFNVKKYEEVKEVKPKTIEEKPKEEPTPIPPVIQKPKKPIKKEIITAFKEGRMGQVLDEDDYYVIKLMRAIRPYVTFPKDLDLGIWSTSLIVDVAPSGFIEDVRLSQSSGNKDLDKAIVDATFMLTRFEPTLSGDSEEVYTLFTVEKAEKGKEQDKKALEQKIVEPRVKPKVEPKVEEEKPIEKEVKQKKAIPESPKPDLFIHEPKRGQIMDTRAYYSHKLTKAVISKVQLPDTLPKGLYPVTIKIEINANGTIRGAKILKSSNNQNLDKSLIDGVLRLKSFDPTPSEKTERVSIKLTVEKTN